MNKKLLTDLVEKKLSISEIADATGKSRSCVHSWLNKYNLKTKHARQYTCALTQKELEKFINDGLSISEIASKINKSTGIVQYYLRQYNVKTHNAKFGVKTKLCKSCEEVDPQKFRKHHASLCSKCEAKRKNYCKKLRAVEYKGGKCIVCGYDKCIGAMDFHHTGEKDPDWKKMRNWKFDRIKTELDKCQLLCKVCHAEKHWSGEWKNII